ncbi:MAG: PAS domain S-box protein [Acidimicrobiia bacterium]
MTANKNKVFQSIVETTTDSIVAADASGDIISWNRAATAMFGYEAGEVIGQPLTILIPDRFHDAHHEGISRVVSTGETRIIGKPVEVAGVKRDGTEFPIELTLGTWLEDGDRYFSGIIRDVSERVAMTTKLEHSQQRLEAILRSANDAIVSVDEEGRVVLWNSHASQLFGYTSDEMVGQPLTAVIPERFWSQHSNGIRRVVGGGEHHVIGKTVELAGLKKGGHEFPIELSLATWAAEDERLFIGIIRDITERKKAEADLQRANDSLNEKNEQLEALSGKLAKYLSRQVYNSIFEAGTEVKLESYRKELTVFFSDIQGFTDLTDRLEAEPVSELLNSYLSDMATIADEYEGTIDKFIGDGIMIFFGDPETAGRKEDALACVRMALAMRERIRELRQGWIEISGSADLHVRIGINTGYCTVGNFGSEDRMDYTIVGGPVNVAARLEAAAGQDQIHIAHDTFTLVKDEIYCRPMGEIMVKGVAHELRTYEVIGPLEELDQSGVSIEPSGTGFNLEIDPTTISADEAEDAKRALRAALAALDDRSDEED